MLRLKINHFSKRGSSRHTCIMKWKHFPRYRPFMRGIHWTPVDSSHKGQWREAFFMFPLMCAWTNRWANNRNAGDLIRHRGHYDTTAIIYNEIGHRCFKQWIVPISLPSPYHHFWHIVKCILWDISQWDWNIDIVIFIEENAFTIAVCKVSVMLFRPPCVNRIEPAVTIPQVWDSLCLCLKLFMSQTLVIKPVSD